MDKKIVSFLMVVLLFAMVGSVMAQSTDNTSIKSIDLNSKDAYQLSISDNQTTTYLDDSVKNITFVKKSANKIKLNDSVKNEIIKLGNSNSNIIYIQNASSYNTSDINSIIQEILDNAPNGCKVKFLGSKYENLHLTINKPLNLIGSNTTIDSKNGYPIFDLNSGASGTNITGFNLISYSNCIYANGVSSVSITKNSFNSKSIAIRLVNAENVLISRNSIISSGTSAKGISISTSQGINITNNNISNNGRYMAAIGIELNDCDGSLINIYSNNISLFNKGIYSATNVRNVSIKSNNIFNCYNGIFLDSGHNMSIVNNKIHDNIDNGILLSGKSEGLIVKSNKFSKNNGTGFIFEGYDRTTNNGLSFESNYFGYNGLDVRTVSGKVEIGTNVANNNCPLVVKKNYKMHVYKNGKDYKIVLEYKGKTASDLPDFTSTILVDGKVYSFTFSGGVATFSSPVGGNSKVTFNYGTQSFEGTLDEALQSAAEVKMEEVARDFFYPEEDNNHNSDSNTTNNDDDIPTFYESTIEGSGSQNSEGSYVGTSSAASSSGSSGSAGGSSASAAASSASAASSSSSVKSLTVDEEFFRVAGVGGLLVLIILVISVYYSRDIYEMFRK